MEDYSRQRHEASGYQFVYTPHITKSELFETSGHLSWFAEGMFPPMELDGGHQYYLKPMNCPFHVLIFKSRQRSYRELHSGCSNSDPSTGTRSPEWCTVSPGSGG